MARYREEAMTITTPGIYQMPAAEYHADPCPTPSLSNSLLKILLGKSPAHAKLAHPRLTPTHKEDTSRAFDLGTAAHAMLLEGIDRTLVVEFDDWRTKDAKAQRDDARAMGLTPLLRHQFDATQEMVKVAQSFMEAMGIWGKSEQTVLWQEGEIWCRARLDLQDRNNIWDYKTTSSPNPDAFIRGMSGFGYDTQDAFYRRGMQQFVGKQPLGGKVAFTFLRHPGPQSLF